MAPRIDYNRDWVAQGWPDSPRESSSDSNRLGCWLYNGSKNTDGYVQVYTKPNSKATQSSRSTQQAFLLHVIAFISKDPASAHDPKLHISHLCDIPNCFNPSHLTQDLAKRLFTLETCCGYEYDQM
ncbi:hypothetical protein B0H14DRAFT_3431541 [Mycena olivaceomarginata]|nr:hypothetical protein B0H14DRAFT_3431541 [Mycena olivaceomarginata]